MKFRVTRILSVNIFEKNPSFLYWCCFCKQLPLLVRKTTKMPNFKLLNSFKKFLKLKKFLTIKILPLVSKFYIAKWKTYQSFLSILNYCPPNAIMQYGCIACVAKCSNSPLELRSILLVLIHFIMPKRLQIITLAVHLLDKEGISENKDHRTQKESY